ncbi:Uncharacterised protein [Janthinobacterium lividum]|nr:Uncharacterised protein [Janthinobacterium lividum]
MLATWLLAKGGRRNLLPFNSFGMEPWHESDDIYAYIKEW